MVNIVDESNFDKEVLKSPKVLVDFNATWCGPCRMLAPVLLEFSKNAEVKVCSCDVDNSPNLAHKYGINSIPCLVLLENGIEIKRHIGFINLDELKDFVGE